MPQLQKKDSKFTCALQLATWTQKLAWKDMELQMAAYGEASCYMFDCCHVHVKLCETENYMKVMTHCFIILLNDWTRWTCVLFGHQPLHASQNFTELRREEALCINTCITSWHPWPIFKTCKKDQQAGVSKVPLNEQQHHKAWHCHAFKLHWGSWLPCCPVTVYLLN